MNGRQGVSDMPGTRESIPQARVRRLWCRLFGCRLVFVVEERQGAKYMCCHRCSRCGEQFPTWPPSAATVDEPSKEK